MYLELTVINALCYRRRGDLANNFHQVLTYLRDSFVDARVQDPSNTNNAVSDDLYRYEKQEIAASAAASIQKSYWSEIVW